VIVPAECSRANNARPPLLKWAGGKRWLINRSELHIPQNFNRYVEPFFGGGALFFHLRPQAAILADINAELIDTYRSVRDDWLRVEEKLSEHASRHCKDYFYSVRSSTLDDPTSAAARFIYLNRTCWNGLYRVNRKGEFNVPIGTKTKVFLEDELQAISKALANATLSISDFGQTMGNVGEGDFVYIDPPYTVKHNVNGFLKYNQTLFSWDDQIRLRDEVVAAQGRGAKLLVSNAAHESLQSLYKDVGEVVILERYSVIAGNSSGRKREQEILVKCY
jgi:DNA adenine methylase